MGEWFDTGGGPPILLEHRLARYWSGLERASERRSGASHSVQGSEWPDSDYSRACSVDDYVELIPLLDGNVIVLGDEPFSTQVRREPTGLLVARWSYAPSKGHMEQVLLDAPSAPEAPGLQWDISDGSLILMDSALRLDEGGFYRVPDVEPGTYRVVHHLYSPDEETQVLLIWIRKGQQLSARGSRP
ncbi:MAG: Imm21 family immunity protein [Myxococcota bacterium]